MQVSSSGSDILRLYLVNGRDQSESTEGASNYTNAVSGNKDDLRRFLGLVAYVAKFLENKAQLTAQLRELLKDDVPWCWNAVHEEALQQPKKMITTAPLLAYYSSHVTTVVSADASSFGIGAVLFRVKEDGRRAPVTYISRSLSADEQRFSQIEKNETLAMAWACEKLHCYVLAQNSHFLLRRIIAPWN